MSLCACVLLGPSEIDIITISFVQMRSRNFREIKRLNQGYTARKWQRQNEKKLVGTQA